MSVLGPYFIYLHFWSFYYFQTSDLKLTANLFNHQPIFLCLSISIYYFSRYLCVWQKQKNQKSKKRNRMFSSDEFHQSAFFSVDSSWLNIVKQTIHKSFFFWLSLILGAIAIISRQKTSLNLPVIFEGHVVERVWAITVFFQRIVNLNSAHFRFVFVKVKFFLNLSCFLFARNRFKRIVLISSFLEPDLIKFKNFVDSVLVLFTLVHVVFDWIIILSLFALHEALLPNLCCGF